MDEKIIFWFFAAIVVFVILMLATRVSSKRAKEDATLKAYGSIGEKVVGRRLKRFGFMRNYKYLNNVYFPLYDSTTQIDHIVIGSFGVLIVETKNFSGEVYGNPAEKDWLQVKKGIRRSFYNPIMQNKTHVDNIRHIFAEEEIYNVKVYSLVVFADKKLELNVPPGCFVVKINKLKRELKRRVYRVDNGVDVDLVYQTLQRHRIESKRVESKHSRDVRKASKH